MKHFFLAALSSLLFPNLSFARSSESPYLPQNQVELPNYHGHTGVFPRKGDRLNLVPCLHLPQFLILPDLNDPDAAGTWARTAFVDDPSQWWWESGGLYFCGYIDVPLDYTNSSDSRIARLAIAKYQVSDKPSERTIVYNPGGPGGGGATSLPGRGSINSKRLSNGTFDFLGFDPRGVSNSLPSVSCYPHNADRDRWSQLVQQAHAEFPEPRTQLELADAMNNATLNACFRRLGDLGRFMTTAFVARDVEEIRKALGEDTLTAHMVSYGTGIGQTYASMFPDKVGRMILDGTENVRDHRVIEGFGYTALDNGTDAWHDGFIGECARAGPEHCALMKNETLTGLEAIHSLDDRMSKLFKSLIRHPKPAYTKLSGPSIITYSVLVHMAYATMYDPSTWPNFASMLAELEEGNTTTIAHTLEMKWEYQPGIPTLPGRKIDSDELAALVICGDSYDAPRQSLDWWEALWGNMTEKSWIAGDSRFMDVFPCRHFTKYWPQPAEVYRRPLNKTLNHPVLLIAETYDPATPLRNGRRLLAEMGDNARLVVHHGYGHSSPRDMSNCTESFIREYMLHGTWNSTAFSANGETDCYPNGKPYLTAASTRSVESKTWRQRVEELRLKNPRLMRGL